ncbi:DUF6745 domain-containing protein [Allocoleopsis franciscana]|uniref:DUF6745 domain-containing protein n=1 Tax=Allocoleopsis franciscana PCC 7113 TaxID=1173027 RepID=K9WGG2_9CYAN|nr:hypothetical protein [Allocoleopsis franciscana]AFZ19495.1 hypothetical protein Mic7113_3777 [Allocoleopsis franciscana PCC 7113]
MRHQQITELTPEQQALMPIIRDEWIRIGLDITPINPQKAEHAIALAYKSARLKPPQKILWFKNPVEALTYIASEADLRKEAIRAAVFNTAFNTVRAAVGDAIRYVIEDAIAEAVEAAVEDTLFNVEMAVKEAVGEAVFDQIGSAWGLQDVQSLARYAYFDAIGVDCSKLKGLWATAKHCGWWWAFKNIAVVTPKPSMIHLDEQGRLHGLGVPAVAYERFNVYAYHGVRLPEKYGAVQPHQWQAKWLLEENNTELRRILIQEIGYVRICQELQALELDSWQEYTLLKIDSDVDVEPIHLLKMTCPSTGYIHALRVPPDVQSVREAIAWVNWGINSEEFSVQT